MAPFCEMSVDGAITEVLSTLARFGFCEVWNSDPDPRQTNRLCPGELPVDLEFLIRASNGICHRFSGLI